MCLIYATFLFSTNQSFIFLLIYCMYEHRHTKTDLKMFVIVTPQDGFVGTTHAKPSFGMTPPMEYKKGYYS